MYVFFRKATYSIITFEWNIWELSMKHEKCSQIPYKWEKNTNILYLDVIQRKPLLKIAFLCCFRQKLRKCTNLPFSVGFFSKYYLDKRVSMFFLFVRYLGTLCIFMLSSQMFPIKIIISCFSEKNYTFLGWVSKKLQCVGNTY